MSFPPSSSSVFRCCLAAGTLLMASLLGAAPAYAGGVGIMTTGGAHIDRVDSYTCDTTTGDCTQEDAERQFNPNVGTGVELVLGDKDNKVLGIFRGYYMIDSAQKAPSVGNTYAIRETARPIGVINAGIQWGLLGNADRLQFTAVTTIGSGFMTEDLTEFLVVEAGVGGTYMVARHVQLALSVTGGTRYRKGFFPTADGYLGVRYLFD